MNWSLANSVRKQIILSVRGEIEPLRCCKHEKRCETYSEHLYVVSYERKTLAERVEKFKLVLGNAQAEEST